MFAAFFRIFDLFALGMFLAMMRVVGCFFWKFFGCFWAIFGSCSRCFIGGLKDCHGDKPLFFGF